MNTKKKKEENVKEEFFRSLKEMNNECDTAFNKMVEQVAMPDNVISIINQYDEIARTQKEQF